MLETGFKSCGLNCVEGWSFIAKWTGVKIADLYFSTDLEVP
ncbi:hypothetical protein [Methanosarcina barkeri]|nr:hypothetical protein [Methanosarcina barkeri]